MVYRLFPRALPWAIIFHVVGVNTDFMMRLPKFEYRVPRTIAEAVKLIADAGPEGQFVAGGTDLYPNMKRRQQTPRTVISV